jgi:hypothetical protein
LIYVSCGFYITARSSQVLKEEDICWPHSFDYITRLNTLSGRQIYISIQLAIDRHEKFTNENSKTLESSILKQYKDLVKGLKIA